MGLLSLKGLWREKSNVMFWNIRGLCVIKTYCQFHTSNVLFYSYVIYQAPKMIQLDIVESVMSHMENAFVYQYF